jgi:transposase-like protein
MRTRNTYHSTVKIAYALDIHKQWLPEEFIKSIPRSTSHAWKYDSTEKYVGQEYAIQINDNVEELKLMYDRQVALEKRLFIAYTRVKLTIIHIFGKDVIKQLMKDNYKAVMSFIMSSKNSFQGGSKTLCKFLDINPQQFSYWLKAAKNHCTNSPTGICLKQFPGQVRLNELQTIRRLLNRRRFKHWPIASVWAYAVRNNHVQLSLENNNSTVHSFIRKAQVEIHKKIALKDIKQSNAMIEAHNKILKYQYLFRKPQPNTIELRNHLEEAIRDYCTKRPHYHHKLYTPFEIHYDCKPELDEKSVSKQVKERIQLNQTRGCGAVC